MASVQVQSLLPLVAATIGGVCLTLAVFAALVPTLLASLATPPAGPPAAEGDPPGSSAPPEAADPSAGRPSLPLDPRPFRPAAAVFALLAFLWFGALLGPLAPTSASGSPALPPVRLGHSPQATGPPGPASPTGAELATSNAGGATRPPRWTPALPPPSTEGSGASGPLLLAQAPAGSPLPTGRNSSGSGGTPVPLGGPGSGSGGPPPPRPPTGIRPVGSTPSGSGAPVLATPGTGSGAAPAAAADPAALGWDPEELTRVDFREVEIKEVLRFLAEKTRTNYFLDPAVSSKLTVIGPRPIALKDAIVFLEAALEARGFTVVDSGTFKEVIPKTKAPKAAVPLHLDPPTDLPTDPLALERTVTEIIDLDHAPVGEVKAALTALLSEGGQLVEHVATNKLILTAPLRNLERLKRVLTELDVPVVGKTVHLMPLRFRRAEKLVTQITEILAKEEREKRIPQTKQEAATQPAVLPDPTQNTLIVVATRSDAARIRALVKDLDRDPAAGPAIEFLELEYAEPEEIAKQVTAALKLPDGATSPGFTLVADPRTRSLMLRTNSPNLAAEIRAAVARLDVEARTRESARVRVYRLNYAEAGDIAELLGKVDFRSKVGGTEDEPDVKIAADEHTNSLLITAPPRYFPAIEAILKELDVFKPQVVVEVLIAEVDYDWARGVGLDFNVLNEVSSSVNRPFAIGNTDGIEEAFGGGGLPNGLSFGVLHGRTFDAAAAAAGDISELSKIGLLIRMFQGTSHANILSAPVLMTSDNEEARIAVGERVQLPASFATAANTGLNTVTSFNSEDLGVILEITPRITQSEHVIMQVDQKIKARTGDVLGGLQTPVLSNREVQTNIGVRDGQTVVIGGLLSESEDISNSKVPLLGDLPGIGRLFRRRSRNTRKTNLLIFLTPRIIWDAEGITDVTARARKQIAESVEKSRASKNAIIREVFKPGRSLGRFVRQEEPEGPPSSGGEDEQQAVREARAAEIRGRVDALFDRIRSRLDVPSSGG